MIKALIFDLDGTIGNTLLLCIEAFRKTIEPLTGRTFTNEEIIASFGPSEEGTIRKLIPDLYEQGLSDYLRHYAELHDAISPAPFEGMKEILTELKKSGTPLALVTGKGEKSCQITLEKYGMEKCFDKIETGSAAGPCKPDGLRAVLRYFSLTPDQAVYVGDAPSDIDACRETGVPVISVSWAETADENELRRNNPDYLFNSVSDFRSFLEDSIGL